jgi:hypothetical protein
VWLIQPALSEGRDACDVFTRNTNEHPRTQNYKLSRFSFSGKSLSVLTVYFILDRDPEVVKVFVPNSEKRAKNRTCNELPEMAR